MEWYSPTFFLFSFFIFFIIVIVLLFGFIALFRGSALINKNTQTSLFTSVLIERKNMKVIYEHKTILFNHNTLIFQCKTFRLWFLLRVKFMWKWNRKNSCAILFWYFITRNLFNQLILISISFVLISIVSLILVVLVVVVVILNFYSIKHGNHN